MKHDSNNHIRTILMTISLSGALVLAGCGGGGTTSSATPPTSSATTQVIWQNATLGCWAGNCSTGGMVISDQSFTHQTTVSNTLEIDGGMPISGSGATFGSAFSEIKLLNFENQNSYASGHLTFDIMLGQPASAYAGIGVATGGGCGTTGTVLLSPGSLSQSGFTNISVPLSTCTLNYPVLFQVALSGTSSASSSLPDLYLNNIIWTTN